MCWSTNSPTRVCNKSVDTLLHGMNHRTVIKWCDSSRRIMKQMMAHYRLCPRNLTSKTCPAPAPIQDDNDNGGGGGNGGITTVFQAVCMAIHCYWPENPQYARVVEPKIESEMRRLLRQLDAEDAIALYALPRAGKGVWWPEYTRGWSQPDWNGEAGGVVTRQCREILGGVELGKPLPAWARDYDDDDYQDECEDDARAGENDLGEDRAVEVDENLYEREDEGQDEDDYQQEQHQTQEEVEYDNDHDIIMSTEAPETQTQVRAQNTNDNNNNNTWPIPVMDTDSRANYPLPDWLDRGGQSSSFESSHDADTSLWSRLRDHQLQNQPQKQPQHQHVAASRGISGRAPPSIGTHSPAHPRPSLGPGRVSHATGTYHSYHHHHHHQDPVQVNHFRQEPHPAPPLDYEYETSPRRRQEYGDIHSTSSSNNNINSPVLHSSYFPPRNPLFYQDPPRNPVSGPGPGLGPWSHEAPPPYYSNPPPPPYRYPFPSQQQQQQQHQQYWRSRPLTTTLPRGAPAHTPPLAVSGNSAPPGRARGIPRPPGQGVSRSARQRKNVRKWATMMGNLTRQGQGQGQGGTTYAQQQDFVGNGNLQWEHM